MTNDQSLPLPLPRPHDTYEDGKGSLSDDCFLATSVWDTELVTFIHFHCNTFCNSCTVLFCDTATSFVKATYMHISHCDIELLYVNAGSRSCPAGSNVCFYEKVVSDLSLFLCHLNIE